MRTRLGAVLLTLVIVTSVVTPFALVTAAPAAASVAPASAEDATRGSVVPSTEHAPGFGSGGAAADKLGPGIKRQLSRAGSGDKIPVIVVFERQPDEVFDLEALSNERARSRMISLARTEQERVRSYLEEQRRMGRADDIKSFWLVNAMAVEATPEVVLDLASASNVAEVVYDQEIELQGDDNSTVDRLLDRMGRYGNVSARPSGYERETSGLTEWSVEYIGADDVQERGVTGEGVNVSVIDTGIDDEHPALRGQVIKWKDFVNTSNTEPIDPNGHGTHVAGTIAGRTDAKRAVGVAPGANLFGARILDAGGSGRVSDALDAFEWSVNNSADVVSGSFGISPLTDDHSAAHKAIQPSETASTEFGVSPNATGLMNTSSLNSSEFRGFSAFKPSYMFVVVEPTGENGTSLSSGSQAQTQVMRNLSVTMTNPSGNRSLKRVEAGWLFTSGDVPDSVGVWKFKPNTSRPVADGNWTFNVTSSHPTNVSFTVDILSVYPTNGSDLWSEAAGNLADQGVVPVFAAGNAGFLGNRSLNSPGASEKALTVGATGFQTNDVAAFSSRGPVGFGTNTRPGIDLLAPGTGVVSSIPDHLTVSGDYSDAYAAFSGTSMATPHVSGVAALVLSANSGMSPSQVKSTLTSTTQSVPGGINAVGSGVLDAWVAVNSTSGVNLGSRPAGTEVGVHDLFAGLGNTSSGWVSDEIRAVRDPRDAPSGTPDIFAVSRDVTDQFTVATYDSPRNATFYLYVDADRDDSTGDANESGAEYRIAVNRTYMGGSFDAQATSYEYDPSTDSYVRTFDISMFVFDASSNLVEADGISFSNEDEGRAFEWHVTAAPLGGSAGDRAPDASQQSFPLERTIPGVAVAWNATAGTPSAGETVTFTLYNGSGVAIATRNATTGAGGFARVNFTVNVSTGFQYYSGDFTLEIEDEHGNEVTQFFNLRNEYIPGLLDETSAAGDIGDFTVQDRDYGIERNGTVTVNVPIYNGTGDSLAPYNGNASVRVGYSWWSDVVYRNNLTVTDGVLRATFNFSNMTVDDGRFDVPVYVALESDFQNATQTAFAADVEFRTGFVATVVGPPTTVTPPGQPVNQTFQSTIYRTDDTEPANVSIIHETLWITDRQVAAFYADLPRSTARKIERLRVQAYSGETSIELTDEDRAEIREAYENVTAPQGFSAKITRGRASPTKNGVGQFSVTPPEDAWLGFVFNATADTSSLTVDDAFGSGGLIFVDDRLRQYLDKPTEPEEEDRYDLDVEGFWPEHEENGWILPNDTMTVRVELWDTEAGTRVGGETVRVYSTTGDVRTVTTSSSGPITIEMPVPQKDWQNTSYYERRQQVVGIAEGFQESDGSALADDEFFYGSVFQLSSTDDSGVEAFPEPSWNDSTSTLRVNVTYRNSSTFNPANATRTLLTTSTPNAEYGTVRDVNVSFVNPPSSMTKVSYAFDEPPIPSGESRQYEVLALTGQMAFHNERSLYVGGVDVDVMAPREVIPGQQASVDVRLTDRRSGDPITNAVVVMHYMDFNEETALFGGDGPMPGGDSLIAMTDSNGEATFSFTPAVREDVESQRFVFAEFGFATENVSEQFAAFESMPVATGAEPVNVTGQFDEPDGSAAVDRLVEVVGEGSDPGSGGQTFTDSNGGFSIDVTPNSTYDVGFFDTTGSSSSPDWARNGVLDVYSVDHISVGGQSVDLGSKTLPQAHVLNVTVVDEDGDRVQDARVDITHTNNGADNSIHDIQTNADGMLQMNGVAPGIEVTGDIDIEVSPPDETRFVDRTYTRDLSVTGDTSITIQLEERVSISGRLLESDGDAAANDSVGMFGEVEHSDLHGTLTDTDGNFTAFIHPNSTHDVQYYQADFSVENPPAPGAWARDDSPDVYAVDRVVAGTSPVDLGTRQLPNASTLNVTVVNETGAPVENATVHVRHVNAATGADAELPFPALTNTNGMLELPEAPAPGIELAGNVSIAVRPPEGADGFKDAVHRRNLEVTNDTTITIVLQEEVRVTGRINTSDGTPAASDFVVAGHPDRIETFDTNLTDAQGRFALSVGKNVERVIAYKQYNETADHVGVRDGSVDFWPLRRVNLSSSTDIGGTTLPAGHPLNVTVVDEDGDPVDNASVVFRLKNDDNGATSILPMRTHPDGMVYPRSNPMPGFEVNGTVNFTVRPPSPRFVDKAYTRNLTVSGARDVTITLEEVSGAVVTGYTASPAKVLPGEDVTINATVENPSNTSNTTTVTFYADGTAVATQSVTVPAGGTVHETFTTNFSSVGTHNVTVNDLPPTDITVGSTISLTDASGSPGDDVTVTLSTTASGVAGYQANLSFNESVVTVKSVSGTSSFSAPVQNIDNGNGTVFISQSRATAVDSPDLATITLHIDGSLTNATSTVLTFQRSDTKVTGKFGNTLPLARYDDGTVSVRLGQRGDANGDGSISSGDATLVLREVVGLSVPGSFRPDLADANQDNSITSGDATLVLRCVVGLPVPFSC